MLRRSMKAAPAPMEERRGPLNIAMMIETVGLGGAEMVVLQMAEELRRRGHTVYGVFPSPPWEDPWLADRFTEAGFEWRTYRGKRPIDPGLVTQLADMLRELRIDAVHSHEFVMAVYGAAAARRIGKPHVITMHGNQDMMARLRRRVALRWAFRHSRATVAVSKDTKRHLDETLGLRAGVVEVIPNGIPVVAGDPAPIRRELALRPGEVLLLAVGSLTVRKGHAILIEAVRQLRQRRPDLAWRVAIAGDGPERENLDAAVRDSGLDGAVHLLGPRADVADLQAAADVFVMPSLWEGLPLAILEAMFASNPIVASRTSGIPEAVDDGREGLLLPPGDAAALSAALERLIGDEGYRRELGRRALARAQAHHTIGVMMDAYEPLYR